MLILQGVTYAHPNGDVLFSNLSLSLNKNEKVALIGNNGAGKSTLLKIMDGTIRPLSGIVRSVSNPYYVPQVVGQFNHLTVSEALHIDTKRKALNSILQGDVSEENLAALDNDWTIEERCREAFSYWNLNVALDDNMSTLSGGQKSKVFLAGIHIHQPEIVLMDEPSNHLDAESRSILYKYITTTNHSLVVVSHDRTLLNLLDITYELNKHGVTLYGGNYDFYSEQKQIEREALQHELKSKEKALRKAKEIERETSERQQKLDARGKKKQEKAGLPTIMMKTLRNNAERSTAKIKDVHAEKLNDISSELSNLRKQIPAAIKMKFDLNNSSLHKGKVLVRAVNINFAFCIQESSVHPAFALATAGRPASQLPLWSQNLTFEIRSADRVAIHGSNGSGKTTLIKLILGELEPTIGTIEHAPFRSVYIDQDYSLINNSLTVFEQIRKYNHDALEEHELKIRLNRFLFDKDEWDKRCTSLSGGEKMRLMLCSLMVANQMPDVIVLDEPTNNLDLENVEILTNAINEYEGTLIVVSHDEKFLEEVGVETRLTLNPSPAFARRAKGRGT
jgi:ATPase subunit of ABC transporter with duplicated ATPase domains